MELTQEQCIAIIETVHELAKEYPDAVYNQYPCRYNSGHVEGCPNQGCIFGQALRLNDIDTTELDSGIVKTIDDIIHDDVDTSLLLYMCEIQQRQDIKRSWGESINLTRWQHIKLALRIT